MTGKRGTVLAAAGMLAAHLIYAAAAGPASAMQILDAADHAELAAEVADAELALQRLLRGIVLDAEELAEVEAGLVDVVLVVLDKAGALAHHALAEPVEKRHVVLVVGDREQPASLVVPGQRLFVVTRPCLAHGGGERGEGGLGH